MHSLFCVVLPVFLVDPPLFWPRFRWLLLRGKMPPAATAYMRVPVTLLSSFFNRWPHSISINHNLLSIDGIGERHGIFIIKHLFCSACACSIAIMCSLARDMNKTWCILRALRLRFYIPPFMRIGKCTHINF